MKKRMVQYRVKKERVAENEALVKEVYKQLKEAKPKDFKYATYKLEDGQTFIHMFFDLHDSNPLKELSAFKNFQANVKERCEVQPTFTDVIEIGSYGFGE